MGSPAKSFLIRIGQTQFGSDFNEEELSVHRIVIDALYFIRGIRLCVG